MHRDLEMVLRSVKLVVTDFDGVLTDNNVYVFDDGHEAVRCSRADGLACELLREAGVEVVILSTERNPVVGARAAKMRIDVMQDCADKGAAIRELLRERGLEPIHVLYVGNDANDSPALAAVPLTAAPADAHRSVRDRASIVTRAVGGRGVLRELADILLAAR
jgi:YrbI family 3-deoxy-D-manno-octulosonate 8-phosphate phosphatase